VSLIPEHIKFGWKNSEPTCAHEYILPEVLNQIQFLYHDNPIQILDIGCGNGYVASQLAQRGHSVTAIDVSPDGIEIARSAYPGVRFEVYSLYEDNLMNVVAQPVDCVVSLEVIEHLFYPRMLFEQSRRVLKDGGYLILSTPYHGYLKNLATSVLNRWDRHFGVIDDGGHIKFFSNRTLTAMACSSGFKYPRFLGVGRLPWLWKSMVMVLQK
jgi:2-polyprenyl-3-methyl-5-hydroxy-6-metoxy-1,4-benzoquinol methylase